MLGRVIGTMAIMSKQQATMAHNSLIMRSNQQLVQHARLLAPPSWLACSLGQMTTINVMMLIQCRQIDEQDLNRRRC